MTTALPPTIRPQDRSFLGEEQVAVRARLAEEVRALIDAVVLTDVPDAEIAEITGQVRALTDRLGAARLGAAPMADTPIDGLIASGMSRQLGNPVTGVLNPVAPPIPFEALPDGSVRSVFTLDEPYEGPPGLVHGGISAAIFDQVLGMTAGMSGVPGFTATLELRYRRPTPLRVPLTLKARITRREGRKCWADGEITTPDGRVTVEATAMFVTPRHLLAEEADEAQEQRTS
ncbi:acyl-coenzyme A thioesterase PaaI-like protein [Actinocorallia herbida]|uniref:Acyl-coenzyme A thioesterase THEM4 n=1 Tax=Actinocorallia herbida TaxID=58109 RepID=A0A3N1CQB1_9ACTN|nr:PaaI family thioesterase [Actinocorallia herbida]ROO83482.1 acyl-coenzyme A thioesterase PaaI-like protein [Actinocorallia herbida]